MLVNILSKIICLNILLSLISKILYKKLNLILIILESCLIIYLVLFIKISIIIVLNLVIYNVLFLSLDAISCIIYKILNKRFILLIKILFLLNLKIFYIIYINFYLIVVLSKREYSKFVRLIFFSYNLIL
jgi:hypothetical protein